MSLLAKAKSLPGLKSVALSLRNSYLRVISRPKWARLTHSDRICIELGSGAKKGSDGWTTIDLGGADIWCDLRAGIPLPDGCVDRIYTSHMFEHIPYIDLLAFIAECHRVLKPGGELSVCVPNARLYIAAYMEGKEFGARDSFYEPAYIDTGSTLDQVNYIAYMGGQHSYLFDEENLVNTLKKSPFANVTLRGFEEEVDLVSRDFESIYARAVK